MRKEETKILNEKTIEENILTSRDYKYGFYTDIETDRIPKGLSEETIRLISQKKNEPAWMLEWRLKAYRHWLTMKEPHWPNFKYGPIDYQESAITTRRRRRDKGPKALTRSTPNCARLLKNWAFRWASKNG